MGTKSNGKSALITGITGQDGAYLAEFLLEQGYEVHGVKRRASSFNTDRIDHLYRDPHEPDRRMVLHYGDLTDATNLIRIVQEVQPERSTTSQHRATSRCRSRPPEYTANSDALGTLRLLEAIRICGLVDEHAASTKRRARRCSAKWRKRRRRETTPFYPRSPYAAAKVYAYWITVNYREAYGLFACNGILFNHESPVRGETFVTRKITRGLARIKAGLDECLYLGNLDALRDWGHARDYVRAQWLMLQQATPEDYVIATGEQHSVRDFVASAAAALEMPLRWHGSGLEEHAIDGNTGRTVVRVDPRYFRPAEVDALLGDASKARRQLGWSPTGDLRGARARDGRVRLATGAARCSRRARRLRRLQTSRMNKDARVFVAGAARPRGLGDLPRRWRHAATTNVLAPPRSALDLRDRAAVDRFFESERPEYVFMAAAKVGGIVANDTYPADFIRDNLEIQTN